MRQITTAQFNEAVKFDPAWASKLTEPVEITDYCDMSNSKITHLSPLLYFTGKNKEGDCADFTRCKFLKIAEGKFKGWVGFSESGIEKIRDLYCGNDYSGVSTDFTRCRSLKIAEGKFPGRVSFSESGIEKIGDLSCGKDNYECSADFTGCDSLKIAQGKFEGRVYFNKSGIEKIGDLYCGKNYDGIRLNVNGCPNLKSIPHRFDPKEVNADPELIEKLEVDRFIQKKRKEIVEIEL